MAVASLGLGLVAGKAEKFDDLVEAWSGTTSQGCSTASDVGQEARFGTR